MRVTPKIVVNTEGLDDAERILVGSLNRGMEALGVHLQKALRSRVRVFSGQERKNIQFILSGRGLNKSLYVFGDTVQLHIDEEGLPPGTFPPYGPGSNIARYATRKGRLNEREKGQRRRVRRISHVTSRRPGPRPKRNTGRRAARKGRQATAQRQPRSARVIAREKAGRRIAFLIARAVYERGIKAGQPISKTFDANRAKIIRDMQNAFLRAVNQINRG